MASRPDDDAPSLALYRNNLAMEYTPSNFLLLFNRRGYNEGPVYRRRYDSFRLERRGTEPVSISLLVAGPSTLANDALCRAFNQRRKHFNVVGSVHTRKDFLKQVAEDQPDVALIDVNLENKPRGGLQTLRELSLTRSSTSVIVLLDCPGSEQVVEAFSHGARGVFCYSEGFAALCKCIRSVHAGQVWADSNQLRCVVQALGERKPIRIVSATGTPLLTKREEQIVRMVAEGLPNSDISKSLGLSSHTVRNHLFSIYTKLGISNRAELVLYALASRDVPRGGEDPPKQSASQSKATLNLVP